MAAMSALLQIPVKVAKMWPRWRFDDFALAKIFSHMPLTVSGVA